ncbi:transporter major facilitator family protein [Firmicutes bacterium CAG:646]|nr:transporter major facilitator family protein [Firmicutes bacterium CAG:646]
MPGSIRWILSVPANEMVSKMKILEKVQVKHQYSVVQALYWMTSCALAGYAAVYLQDRGLSNTLIGVTVGGAACLSMVIQPLAAQVVESISGLTVKKVIQALIVMMAVMFGVLTVIPVPVAGVVILYMGMNTLNYCMPPMLSAMGMEFINRGYYLNFGLSRGLGSISYAVCAAVLGIVIDRFFPGVLGYIYVVLAILLFLAVSAMKDLEAEEPTFQQEIVEREKKPEESIWKTVCKNKTFLCLMIGFCLANMNNAAIATYTVNIIKNLGGSDTVLGFANFVSAASEMPVMLLFGYFMKKGNCIRLLKVSAVFFLIKPLVLVFANALPLVILGLGLQGLSFGLFTPAAVYYVNSTLIPEQRVKGQAIFSTITAGAATCGGNVLGGWLQDAFGLQTMLWVCAAMALVGVLFVIGLSEKEKG